MCLNFRVLYTEWVPACQGTRALCVWLPSVKILCVSQNSLYAGPFLLCDPLNLPEIFMTLFFLSLVTNQYCPFQADWDTAFPMGHL